MAAEEKKENNETLEKKGKSGFGIKVIILIIALIFAAGGGFFGWKMYASRMAALEQKQEEPAVKIGTLWSLGPMIVNLLDNEGERYLKVNIEIELSSSECATELDLLRPKIMDGILDLLSSKSYKEIVGFEGKQHLRDEISMRVNNYLSRGRIVHVYFTEFVVQ